VLGRRMGGRDGKPPEYRREMEAKGLRPTPRTLWTPQIGRDPTHRWASELPAEKIPPVGGLTHKRQQSPPQHPPTPPPPNQHPPTPPPHPPPHAPPIPPSPPHTGRRSAIMAEKPGPARALYVSEGAGGRMAGTCRKRQGKERECNKTCSDIDAAGVDGDLPHGPTDAGHA